MWRSVFIRACRKGCREERGQSVVSVLPIFGQNAELRQEGEVAIRAATGTVCKKVVSASVLLMFLRNG